MSVLNLNALMMIGDTGAFGLVFALVVIAVSYAVLWRFWQGRNWARWLVMITSVIALSNLAFVAAGPSWPLRIVLAAEALLGLFLLYWLNTKPVRAYFTPAGHAVPESN